MATTKVGLNGLLAGLNAENDQRDAARAREVCALHARFRFAVAKLVRASNTPLSDVDVIRTFQVVRIIRALESDEDLQRLRRDVERVERRFDKRARTARRLADQPRSRERSHGERRP